MISALTMFASSPLAADPIRFLVGLVLACCVIAVVIILIKWLLGLAGIAIPQPLMLILGIIAFIMILLWLLSWSGVYRW